MEYHEFNLVLEQPSVKLLRAQNAPMLLGFLHQTFKREHKVTIPEGQLRASLTAFLDELREADPLAYPKSAAEYLADWCGEGQRFLRRYYGNDANEPLFELTTGSEKALLWLESSPCIGHHASQRASAGFIHNRLRPHFNELDACWRAIERAQNLNAGTLSR